MNTKELLNTVTMIHSLITYNPIKPITGLVELYAKEGIMKLGSTDGFTTVVAKVDCENDIDNAVISLSILLKLLKLTTKDAVEIKNMGKYIEFKGNGKYKIPIQLEADGSDIVLPLSMDDLSNEVVYKPSDFELAIKRNKVAVYDGDSHEDFKLYYNYNGLLVTTNSMILAMTKIPNLPAGAIKPFIVESLSKLDNDILMGKYRAHCDNFEIQFNNKVWDDFPIDVVKPFIEMDFSENQPIILSKKDMLNVIKRQSVFRNPFEEPTVKFCVENRSLVIRNTQGTSEERIDVEVSRENSVAVVKTDYVLGALKNMENDIRLYIEDDFICIEDDLGRYIISVME